MTWRDQALCDGVTSKFYEEVFPDEENPWTPRREGLEKARAICGECTARRECAVDIMQVEDGQQKPDRFGITAAMTPQQRWSLERRGTLRCTCGHVRDPLDLIAGRLHCPRCKIDREVPVIPDQGDKWAKRHTTLARKIITWTVDNVEIGKTMPRPAKMCTLVNASIHDVCHVYEGLVADGTLTASNGSRPTYTRSGKVGATAEWYCHFLDTAE